MGIVGCSSIILVAYLLSENKKLINIRTVSIGFILQVVFGYLVLKWQFGKDVIQYISDGINEIINSGRAGLEFVFGPLADNSGDVAVFGVTVLGIIIFLTILIELLYHFGIMQLVVRFLSEFIAKIMQVSFSESTAAAANMFVGNTQAPLFVNRYVKNMTSSQLFYVMVES